jgi:hypothetical protein
MANSGDGNRPFFFQLGAGDHRSKCSIEFLRGVQRDSLIGPERRPKARRWISSYLSKLKPKASPRCTALQRFGHACEPQRGGICYLARPSLVSLVQPSSAVQTRTWNLESPRFDIPIPLLFTYYHPFTSPIFSHLASAAYIKNRITTYSPSSPVITPFTLFAITNLPIARTTSFEPHPRSELRMSLA